MFVSGDRRLELLHGVTPELLKIGIGELKRHHGFADHARSPHRFHVAPLAVRTRVPTSRLRSTDGRGAINVGIGFIAARMMMGMPLVMPPSRPPARLVRRSMGPASGSEVKSASWTADPGSEAAPKPSPNSTPLMAGMLPRAPISRPSSLSLEVP